MGRVRRVLVRTTRSTQSTTGTDQELPMTRDRDGIDRGRVFTTDRLTQGG